MLKKVIVSGASEDIEVKEKKSDFPQDLFKTVSELTTDGLAILENGRFLLVNDQLLETFKVRREEIIGTETLKFVHKDDIELAIDELRQNRKVFYELKLKRGDGIYIHTEVRAHPILFDGRECRLLMLRDMTQRKIADRLFANYLNIVDAFPETICVHDKSGKILFANKNGIKHVGAKSEEELRGRNVMEFILPEYHAMIKEDKPKIERLEAITGRFVKIRHFTEPEPKSVEASVIPIEWGEQPAVMVLCHDASLEEQIERSEIAKQVMQSVNEHLQWEIAEHKNLEAKLKKMIEEKEWLLKEVNHRVKNNLQIITSILNLQINQMNDKHLVPVMREFQNRFYALSSIYSSLYHTDTNEEIDISAYLKDLTHNLFISYSDPGKHITINCDTSRIFLEYDDAITCGLLVNEIVSNSIKHAFPGNKPGKILVVLKQTGQKVKFVIADNGIGMSVQRKKQSHVSLGLQLVDSLVTQLKNGVMKKESGPKGTKYTITFISKMKPPKKSK
ncbi:MAG: histidine kinase dimerization/phosphoacceptor domain -containing protein [Bacteroidia bacterium]